MNDVVVADNIVVVSVMDLFLSSTSSLFLSTVLLVVTYRQALLSCRVVVMRLTKL